MRRQSGAAAGAMATALTILAFALLVLAATRWAEDGWGSAAWLAVFVAMCVIRVPHSLRNRANIVVDARKDVLEIGLLAMMFITMMLLPLLHLATGVFSFAAYRLPDWVTWIGILPQLPFLWLFWCSHADLGRNWSAGLEVREDHTLVMDGVYARVRHPMYLAIWISVLAQPLLVHNWIAGFLVIPAFAAMWFIRVPREEALMRARFGAAYDDYCRKAGRLMPRAS